jgi:hypothetical protein
MKKIIHALLIASLSLTIVPIDALGGSDQGQRIFKMKMRKSCRFSGHKFAHSHTQAEWEGLKQNGKFKEETKKLCPRLDTESISDAWWEDIYLFTYEYASDSGQIPSC